MVLLSDLELGKLAELVSCFYSFHLLLLEMLGIIYMRADEKGRTLDYLIAV